MTFGSQVKVEFVPVVKVSPSHEMLVSVASVMEGNEMGALFRISLQYLLAHRITP